ncbi:hypothetical protein EK21DRAFT_115489 [Setomelanomma holmii]|uniref:CCHC-type domain-containing protein n=1 Tax=Setomelanomma holmii TaxID=210430 RepID=A0A9P4H1R3_9PLEO|nr:hypothetical protein EK21DRAFT_115489 [Setomelanomma holmii]
MSTGVERSASASQPASAGDSTAMQPSMPALAYKVTTPAPRLNVAEVTTERKSLRELVRAALGLEKAAPEPRVPVGSNTCRHCRVTGDHFSDECMAPLRCDNCHDTGHISAKCVSVCPACNGNGRIRILDGAYPEPTMRASEALASALETTLQKWSDRLEARGETLAEALSLSDKRRAKLAQAAKRVENGLHKMAMAIAMLRQAMADFKAAIDLLDEVGASLQFHSAPSAPNAPAVSTDISASSPAPAE